MVATAGGEEADFAPRFVENRGDEGNIGEVGAPGVRVVESDRVAGFAGLCRAGRMTCRTEAPMAPRCTGTCGALATRLPAASKMAQEKSSLSLMLTLCAVLRSTAPACSATDMNRLAKSSSSTGLGFAASAITALARGAVRCRMQWLRAVISAAPAGFDDGGGDGLFQDRRAGDIGARAEGRAVVNRGVMRLAVGEHPGGFQAARGAGWRRSRVR